MERLRERLQIGPLEWDETVPDLRALALNNCVRRQRESLEGAISLGRSGHGHLSVGFVRAFLEERLWIGFLGRMTADEANTLLLAMGRWDAIRTLVAQRGYIGDRSMTLNLWYPPGFVDAREASLPTIKNELHELRRTWGWQGTLPTTSWIANQSSLRDEYNYLHSASSRAVHFSAGEVLRRGWGVPGASMVTNNPEFERHLAEFAYDQLWRQHMGTVVEAADLLSEAGVTTTDDFFSDATRNELLSELLSLGQVPLVHAYEWNLRPPPPGTRVMWAAVVLGAERYSASDTDGR